MSQGSRITGGYQSVLEPSAIYRILLNKETTEFSLNGVFNSFPAAVINRQQSVKVDRSRAHGVHPFFVQVVWDGSLPSGYSEASCLWIPLINSDIRNALHSGSPLTGTYLSKPVRIQMIISEVII